LNERRRIKKVREGEKGGSVKRVGGGRGGSKLAKRVGEEEGEKEGVKIRVGVSRVREGGSGLVEWRGESVREDGRRGKAGIGKMWE